MANIREIEEIIENTPPEQAIMLEGIHGIGKSEVIKTLFEKKGYTVITLFLGQMADAGDLIGLPDRTVIEVNGTKMKITEFCPPKWWPYDQNAKVIIFLDEANRGKPEINQCIMDMVLNRKLNGLDLPKAARVIAAINPIDEGYYQVEEMDPAYLDRFNKYDFRPDVDEWIDWAARTAKLHNYVIGFISKNTEMLDPPNSREYRTGKVYPSRRSWVRVANIIKSNPSLIGEKVTLLKTMMLGIVGERAVSAFGKYLKEVGTGFTAGVILTGWNKDIERQLKAYNIQDILHLNKEIAKYFDQKDTMSLLTETKDTSNKMVTNLERYLNTIPAEAMAEFFNLLALDNNNKKWPKVVMSLNPNLANRFIEIVHGEEK